ncbi:MAG: pilus assembly protein [Brevundimonas sp.]|uniref:TadE/TadG family type IV pilus assembly protein n=1 Tax=Brevundimonas sp. TaxID=1871086 RepID=UPI0025C2A154|nr:TadE/TadG family type IV pilus assembly protein [Brevundimonas sp.]MBX3477999.1 pilus assembly protein [Brevundimonas sp.]
MKGRAQRKREGSAAVEFALVGPILVLLLMGLVVYGGWFWMAQAVQTMASEGARAAVAGLDPAERERLARRFIAEQAQAGAGLDPSLAVVSVQSDIEAIRVRVAYDVGGQPLLALAGPLPKPPQVIERTAVVRIGGY